MTKNGSIQYRELDHAHRVLQAAQNSQPSISYPAGDSPNLPDIYFVDSGNGSDGNDGRDPGFPMATIDAAINRCTASQGDVILVQPGHSESLTAAIELDVIGVQILGIGEGTLRPQITLTADDNGIEVSAANCTVENLYFNERTTTPTSNNAYIDVSAVSCKLLSLHFDVGAEDLDSITIAAGGDSLEIGHCRWVTTANGPDSAIRIEAAGVDLLHVHHCLIDGGTVTNAFDEGSIVSGDAHTNCLIEYNTFHAMVSGFGLTFTAAATGVIQYNNFGLGTLGLMLDPGSCMCIENYEQDAVDESGRLFPARNPSIPVGVDEGLFIPGLGHRVAKTLALTQGASPSQDIFTVTGQVLINLFIGEVTTAISNVSIDVTLQIKTSGEDLHAITLIDNDPAGTLYYLDGDPAVALNSAVVPVANKASIPAANAASSILMGLAGGSLTIENVIVGTPANSDVIVWSLWYYKLEASALIVAA